jgi:hypothetical protein
MNDRIKIYGLWDICLFDKDGSFKYRWCCRNGITNAGLDYLLGSSFSNGLGAFPQITAWYAGLIDKLNFVSLAAADTMASHGGWTENTQYSGSRPQWANTEGGQQVASNGPFSFNITGNGNIHGLFISSGSVAGGKTGTLWSTAILPSDAAIATGQTLTGTYQLTAASG